MHCNVNETVCLYSITPCKQFELEGSTHSAYGIACHKNGRLIDVIEDISDDPELVRMMAELFTRCALPPLPLLGGRGRAPALAVPGRSAPRPAHFPACRPRVSRAATYE